MILISRSAARAVFAEIQRFVELGFAQADTPYEALVYPLSALVPAGTLLSPLELAGRQHLRALVLDGAAIPPDAVKSFSPANCHFQGEDLVGASREFNQQIDALLAQRPRLGVHSKLHSHPFAGGAFLSAGDLHHGVRSRKAILWRESKGLATSILHVAYPDQQPRPSAQAWQIDERGARLTGPGRSVRWRVRSWASLEDDTLQDLGDAQVVSDRHPLVRAARRPPYWQTPAGARWCDDQKASLRQAGYPVSRNLLGRGWRRYLVGAGGRQILLALPPDLPATPPRLLHIHDALANHFEPLPLPRWISRQQRLADLSLLQLLQHFGEPNR